MHHVVQYDSENHSNFSVSIVHRTGNIPIYQSNKNIDSGLLFLLTPQLKVNVNRLKTFIKKSNRRD